MDRTEKIIKIYSPEEEEEIFEFVDVDNAGGIVYKYEGELFTGVIEHYQGDKLKAEEGFVNGHIGGVQREYFENGQLQHEYYKYFAKPEGDWKEWSEDGELIHHSVWEKGIKIKSVIG